MALSKKKKQKNVSSSPSSPPEVVSSTPSPIATVWLALIAFFSGFLVMVLELTSSRLLAPYYGNTIYCWTGVIGTILFCLSLGYLLGGIWADRTYSLQRLLFYLLLVSAFFTALIPWVARFFFTVSNTNSIIFGPIWGTLFIFAVPALVLSIMPPLCVKMLADNFQLVGLASGVTSSLAALGSIIGTFATGFVLIPAFNLSTIYYLAATLLVILGCLLALSQKNFHSHQIAGVLAVLGLGSLGSFYQNTEIFVSKGEVYLELTPYHLIRVYDKGDYFALKLDTTNEGALSKEGNRLIFEYTKYWELIKCFRPDEKINKACFVGGGAFAMPLMFHRHFPLTKVDTIEIDPRLIEVGEKYFQVPKDDKNFQIQIEDGRRWFNDKPNEYEFIFLDAFHGVKNIPFHLVTTEYFGELSQSLEKDGILAINMISARKGENAFLYQSIVKGLLPHFPQIFVFSVGGAPSHASSNQILFCMNTPQKLDRRIIERRGKVKGVSSYAKHLVGIVTPENFSSPQAVELTDQYAPVEYFVSQQE